MNDQKEKIVLEEKLAAIQKQLESGIVPVSSDIEDIIGLLNELKHLNEVKDSDIRAEDPFCIKIDFKDCDDKAEASGIISFFKGNQKLIETLYILGMQKLTKESIHLQKELVQSLIENGYALRIKVENSSGIRGEYITLSSRGWSVFQRKKISQEIERELQIPDFYQYPPDKWKDGTLYAIAVLQEQLFKEKNDIHYAVTADLKGFGVPCASEISSSDSIVYFLPVTFENENRINETVLYFIGSERVDKIKLIFESQQLKEQYIAENAGLVANDKVEMVTLKKDL